MGPATLTQGFQQNAVPIFAVNETGQTLYKGNIVELDILQTAARSTATVTQIAGGTGVGQTDSAALSAMNAIVPSTAGIQLGMPHVVVIGDGPIAPHAKFPCISEGIGVEVQVNPFLTQIISVSGTSSGTGSLIFSATNTLGTLTTSTFTFTSSAQSCIVNMTTALGSFAPVSVMTNGTLTNSFTATFSPTWANAGPLIIATNGQTGGTYAITNSTTSITPGTQLVPVAGATFAAPAPYPLQRQVISIAGVLSSFSLTATNTSGTTTLGSVNWSVTPSTLLASLQTAAFTAIPGTTVALTDVSDQFLFTFPYTYPNPQLLIASGYGGTTGAIVVTPSTTPIVVAPVGLGYAMDTIGTPGTYSTTTGNSNGKFNSAPLSPPSVSGTQTIPLSYTTVPAAATGLSWGGGTSGAVQVTLRSCIQGFTPNRVISSL